MKKTIEDLPEWLCSAVLAARRTAYAFDVCPEAQPEEAEPMADGHASFFQLLAADL